jgi:hypothetical protein
VTPVILGIDPGQVSGWALGVDHERILEHGTARNASDRRAAVERAWQVAADRGAPVKVAMEWVTAGGGGARTAMGIGQARGRWLEVLELAGYSAARVIRCTPYQWRTGTHGVVRSTASTREARTSEYKAAAQAYTGIAQPDAAEAACIALWGAAELGIGEAA